MSVRQANDRRVSEREEVESMDRSKGRRNRSQFPLVARRRFDAGGEELRVPAVKAKSHRPEVHAERERELTFVQRIICVGFEEEILDSDHDCVEVENGLPVLAKNVETDVSS